MDYQGVDGLTISKKGDDKIVIATNNILPLAQNGTIDILIVVNDKSFTKTFTYSRIDCGQDGQDGQDGYTIYLTNELHSFYCESNSIRQTKNYNCKSFMVQKKNPILDN